MVFIKSSTTSAAEVYGSASARTTAPASSTTARYTATVSSSSDGPAATSKSASSNLDIDFFAGLAAFTGLAAILLWGMQNLKQEEYYYIFWFRTFEVRIVRKKKTMTKWFSVFLVRPFARLCRRFPFSQTITFDYWYIEYTWGYQLSLVTSLVTCWWPPDKGTEVTTCIYACSVKSQGHHPPLNF